MKTGNAVTDRKPDLKRSGVYSIFSIVSRRLAKSLFSHEVQDATTALPCLETGLRPQWEDDGTPLRSNRFRSDTEGLRQEIVDLVCFSMNDQLFFIRQTSFSSCDTTRRATMEDVAPSNFAQANDLGSIRHEPTPCDRLLRTHGFRGTYNRSIRVGAL